MGQFITQPTQALFFAFLLFVSCPLCTGSRLDVKADRNENGKDKDSVGIGPVIKPETMVVITNYLPNNQSLTLHCKSKDDDLGVHVLPPNGGSFRWLFRMNFWHTTLYFCSLNWSNGAVVFDAYRAKRDYNKRCNFDCDWNVFEDGIHGYTDRGGNDLTIPWNKPSSK
ncbi:hypothetical protein TIFTF001_047166 [Ficus carica]|uniref:S-protein homolog n=1 Tax=Ficus carica TaxID=3494 RepID=A0AA87Z7Z2_FICCA|nr:hypothetical protein TIFTF001_047166 [Ficus carica]